MALVARMASGMAVVKVSFDKEWEEYVVKLVVGGRAKAEADYHTDSREDAIGTAKLILQEAVR